MKRYILAITGSEMLKRSETLVRETGRKGNEGVGIMAMGSDPYRRPN